MSRRGSFEKVAGELMSRRHWRTEKRAGVEHLVAGQHIAVRCDDEDGIPVYCVAYVPASGHAVNLLPVAYEDSRWHRGDFMVTVRSGGAGRRFIAGSWQLSEQMLAALERERARTAEPSFKIAVVGTRKHPADWACVAAHCDEALPAERGDDVCPRCGARMVQAPFTRAEPRPSD